MENNKVIDNKKKVLPFIGLGVLILIVIVIAVFANRGGNEPTTPTGDETQVTDSNTPNDAEEPATEGEEAAPDAADMGEINPILEGARSEAPGADLIATSGKVVNQEGKEVKTDVAYNSPEAPRQTMNLNPSEVTANVTLQVGNNAFSPNEFTVRKGDAVTVAMTGVDDSSHVLAFRDSVLSAVFVNIRPRETRAVTFNAPSQAGRYEFFCDFPGHAARGETGVMIVE